VFLTTAVEESVADEPDLHDVPTNPACRSSVAVLQKTMRRLCMCPPGM
jgi:hypothetical protein